MRSLRGHLRDAGADVANDAAPLVAKTMRQEAVFAAMAARFEKLGVADAAERDFDTDRRLVMVKPIMLTMP